MVLDSMSAVPSTVTRMGDLPSGWMDSSSGGARCVFLFRTWFTSVYSKP